MNSRQSGIALLSAIFLLVVLAALGAYAVRLSGVQQQSTALAIRSAQALHAARSGFEWAAHRAVTSGVCAAGSLTLTEGGAQGFRVAVTCGQTTHLEAGRTSIVYSIEVLAEGGSYGQPDYVSRRLQGTVGNES